MGSRPRTAEAMERAVEAYKRHGTYQAAADALGWHRRTVERHLKDAGLTAEQVKETSFQINPLPSEVRSIEELLDSRKAEFTRVSRAFDARHLIPVEIKIPGPIGVVHFGDPHLDNPGCDLGAVEAAMKTVRETEAMFAANCGDLQDNWVGRLSHLWNQSTTTAKEAWALVEWMVNGLDWLYVVGGNHDGWTGPGDPLEWMMNEQPGIYEPWGARVALQFPNGKEVRINARHDWSGHSMWNTVHGAVKAFKMGWSMDHILTCGHKHTSGYNILKCPATGLVGHAIRIAGFKIHDHYAVKELGLPNQNISPTCTTVIDPTRADDDPGLITVIHDLEKAARFLSSERAL